MIKIYNKLIRDLIPDIIASDGSVAITQRLDNHTFEAALKDKLLEEVDEFLVSNDVEELADILEVVYTIAKLKGKDEESLDKLRKEKKFHRGGFEKQLLLKQVCSVKR